MDYNAERFLKVVKERCKDQGIEFLLSKERQVSADGILCNGYFDSLDRVLAVATGQDFDKWFKTLIHEYSHMTQWLANCKAWSDSSGVNGDADANDIIDLWLKNTVELTEENLNLYAARARNLELDAERRALTLVKQFKLSINQRQYIKRANAYIYFWTHLKKSRKWYTIGNEPYNHQLLVSIMPEHFENDYDNLPEIIEKIYIALDAK